jgi:hypothetical protein
MDALTAVDSLGRKNPAAWAAWSRARNAPVAVALALEGFEDGRARTGGWGARTRRRLARAASRNVVVNVGGN